MPDRTLGSTGPAVAPIGLGCMGMSYAYDPGARDDSRSVSVLRRCLDRGVHLIDTADVYGPCTNEELVGEALTGRREQAVLATKVGFVQSGDRFHRNGRPEHIRSAIDASLSRLGTDHVDLYQLHRVDPEIPIEETWGAMAECVEAGKAKALGLPAVTAGEFHRAQRTHPVAAVQAELSLMTREAIDELLPLTEEHGAAFIAYAPLGRGFLTGRFTAPEHLPADDWRREIPRFQEQAMTANLEILSGVRAVAARHGATAGQVALAWVLAAGRWVIPIPGTKTGRYLDENLRAAELELTEEDLAQLDALPTPVGARQ